METTESGREMELRDEQDIKAHSPMVVTELGINYKRANSKREPKG